MRFRSNLIFYSCVSVLSLIIVKSSAEEQKPEAVRRFIEPDNDYVDKLDLSGNVRRSFAVQAALTFPGKNTVCSPLSALIPLAQLALGAQDKTLTELLAATGVSTQYRISSFKYLINKLKNINSITLDIVSSIYVNKDLRLNSQFRDKVKYVFGSSVQSVDFRNTALVAHNVNNLVKFATKGMIKQIITPPEISPSTSVMLVNAVCFVGKWSRAFERLHPGWFHTPRGSQKATMMSIIKSYYYRFSKILDSQIIGIPYENDSASFYIFLPKDRNGLSGLLKKLTSPDLMKSEMEKMEYAAIDLTIPKFTIESQWNLKELYPKIGENEIFYRGQGISNMVYGQTQHVDKAIQKAIIEVNENGTKAVAATFIVNAGAGLSPKEIPFVADHPFFFMIVAEKEQLFTGVLNHF